MFHFIELTNLLWFYFSYKIIHFQSENTGKKLDLPLNKSKQGFFLFQAVIGYLHLILPIMVCLYKKN